MLVKYFNDEFITKLNVPLLHYRPQDAQTTDSTIHITTLISDTRQKTLPIKMQIIVSFTILDAALEAMHPHISNLNFFKRHMYLPDNTDRERITKSTYRILRLLRNGVVHNTNCLYTTGTAKHKKIVFDYTVPDKKTNQVYQYFLAADQHFFNHLYALLYYILGPARETDVRIPAYIDCLLRKHYKQLYDNTSAFLEESSTTVPLLPPPPGLTLNNYLRYKILNANYSINSGHICIDTYKLTGEEEQLYGKDYIITRGYRAYCIPEEALTKSRLPESDLPTWEVK